ncbi:manganese ABC transporter, ATP-binding protein SitB [Melissococcus plutonius ATCC 35311]|uniref:Manganese ABC transporter, ATP-binding protein SitB n=1 Tax=Melissococcus plutonius (strain ATCC 35311 / DSM 29964 / CIP 104052 / LMG 20360 / NCIMB 702443) TaxID=940190 RepID=F3YBK8_MELPT|nr:iron/zinc/copper transport system ATP-binding protein [Melissococcus plutonius]BAK21886.1 manganese ABC transporter, ATP-binding protein SitB [Melissococcus plutonius ATCC 35311]
MIVHHDLNKVKNYFDQLVILNQYLIAFGKTETIFTQANLKKAYGETVFIGGMEA